MSDNIRRIRTGSFDAVINTTAFSAGIEELQKGLDGVHRETIKRLHVVGRKNLKDSRRRPQEKGEGVGGRRMTGRFEFGRGKTFVGKTFSEGNVQGLGWPDIAVADRRTKWESGSPVWRTLEWGLGNRKMEHPLAPTGDFKFPANAWWLRGSSLVRSKRGQRGDVLRPVGTTTRNGVKHKPKMVVRPDMGLEPKLFLTNAWREVVENKSGYLRGEYTKLERNFSDKFK